MWKLEGVVMQDTIFREYDIRGIVGSELLIDQVYDLSRAIAVLYKQLHPTTATVAVGMDGRTHSPAIAQEMIRGLRDSGLNVIFIGTVPSPVLYFSQFTMPVDAGLMITASHNPQQYNGIKFCLNRSNVWGPQIRTLRDLYHQKAALPMGQGTYQEVDGAAEYVEFLAQKFPHLIGVDVRAIFDCANAVAAVVMPRLIERFGWRNAKLLFAELDGTFPNHEPDPVVEEHVTVLKQQLQEDADALIGIGFDGDADRMAAMTKAGYLIPGDQLLAIFSQRLLQDHPGTRVIFDVRSSAQLANVISRAGGVPHISPCGHATIKQAMKETGALLAGEVSCHFFFADRYFGYDDAIYAALRLIELLQESPMTLDQMVAQLPQTWGTPELRLPCAEGKKAAVVQAIKDHFGAQTGAQLVTIDGVRVHLLHGWGLVRAANTQPAISLRFEADSPGALIDIKKEFEQQLLPFFAQSELKSLR
jgi:phosphomannomutase/phosphoglucomutase